MKPTDLPCAQVTAAHRVHSLGMEHGFAGSDGPLRVVGVDPRVDPRWDAFVRGHRDAVGAHLGAWISVLEKVYGWRPTCLAAVDRANNVRGVLPLMAKRGVVSGSRLRSLPVVPVAGPLGRSTDDEVALMRSAVDQARATNSTLAVAAVRAGYESSIPELQAEPMAPRWILSLPDRAEALRDRWRADSKNLTRNLRKADKAPLTVAEDGSADGLKSFYDLYLGTMRRHRTLPRRLRQFTDERELLGRDGTWRLFCVRHSGRVVAGGTFEILGERVVLAYNASDPSALGWRPNHALYWHVIEWAIGAGLRELDFGYASAESSLGRFKAQWGAEPLPLYAYAYPSSAEASVSGPGQLTSGGTRQRVLLELWGHAPLGLTRVVGAGAYRYL